MTIKTIWLDSKIRKPAMTVLFYTTAFLLIEIFEKLEPSGPCAPGLGMIVFLILIPISIILFTVNLVKTLRDNKTNLISTLLHFLAITIFIYNS